MATTYVVYQEHLSDDVTNNVTNEQADRYMAELETELAAAGISVQCELRRGVSGAGSGVVGSVDERLASDIEVIAARVHERGTWAQ
jgi:hypothetical protein